MTVSFFVKEPAQFWGIYQIPIVGKTLGSIMVNKFYAGLLLAAYERSK
jgi:hypothetical protein